MKLCLLGLMVGVSVLLSGCMLDNSRLYDGSTPEAPQRWPDNVATCALETDAVVPLNIAVTWTKYPYIPGTIAACGGASPGVGYGPFVGSPTLWGIDSTGSGVNGYDVYYEVYMAANHFFCLNGKTGRISNGCVSTSQNIDPTWSYHTPPAASWMPGPDPVRTWTFNRPIFDRTDVINGLKWRHYMFWEYVSLSSDPSAPALPVDSPLGFADDTTSLTPASVVSVPYPDALRFIGEVYEHTVDINHAMFIFALYMRPVTQDAHWFAARRAMLKKLVDAVTITPLTDAQMESYKREAAAEQKAEWVRECADKRLGLKLACQQHKQ